MNNLSHEFKNETEWQDLPAYTWDRRIRYLQASVDERTLSDKPVSEVCSAYLLSLCAAILVGFVFSASGKDSNDWVVFLALLSVTLFGYSTYLMFSPLMDLWDLGVSKISKSFRLPCPSPTTPIWRLVFSISTSLSGTSVILSSLFGAMIFGEFAYDML